MFEVYKPEVCVNHKNQIAEFYEKQSGLHFCHVCRDNLSRASEEDLFLLTHSKQEEKFPKVLEPLKAVKEIEKGQSLKSGKTLN